MFAKLSVHKSVTMCRLSLWYVPTNFLKDPSYLSQIISCYRNSISDIIFKEVLKPVDPEAIALLGDSDLFLVHGNQFVDHFQLCSGSKNITTDQRMTLMTLVIIATIGLAPCVILVFD